MDNKFEHLDLQSFRNIVECAGRLRLQRDTGGDGYGNPKQDLHVAICDLGYEGALELLTVMYVGRDGDDYARTIKAMRGHYDHVSKISGQIASKGPLLEYLAMGMAELSMAPGSRDDEPKRPEIPTAAEMDRAFTAGSYISGDRRDGFKAVHSLVSSRLQEIKGLAPKDGRING